jgi:hypothetical protein
VDLEPVNLVPTWRNVRGGAEGISKRLEFDRFLISRPLLGGYFLSNS